jgi:hypothetical protein
MDEVTTDPARIHHMQTQLAISGCVRPVYPGRLSPVQFFGEGVAEIRLLRRSIGRRMLEDWIAWRDAR